MSSSILQYISSGLVMGSSYALLALGMSVIFRSSSVINLAQGEVMMLGTFLLYSLLFIWKVPLLLAIVIMLIASLALGVGIERLIIGPIGLHNVKSNINWVLSLLGIMILARALATLIWGANIYRFPPLFGKNQDFVIIVVAVLLMMVLDLAHSKTFFGKSLQAISLDSTAARLIGINVQSLIFYSFALAAGLATISGLLIAPTILISVDMGTNIGFKAFAAAMVGGISTPRGAMVGGLLLGVVEAIGSVFMPLGYAEALPFLILIIVLLLKPEGLFATGVQERL